MNLPDRHRPAGTLPESSQKLLRSKSQRCISEFNEVRDFGLFQLLFEESDGVGSIDVLNLAGTCIERVNTLQKPIHDPRGQVVDPGSVAGKSGPDGHPSVDPAGSQHGSLWSSYDIILPWSSYQEASM
jgi:hypothetical protein